MTCRHRRLEVDSSRGWFSCRDCWQVLTRAEAGLVMAGRPLLRVVPGLPEVPRPMTAAEPLHDLNSD